MNAYAFIQQYNMIVTFPDLEIILKTYLTLQISDAGGERTFHFSKE